VLVEQFLWTIALHPVLESLEMPGLPDVCDRHLVRPERTFHRFAIDLLGPCPSFRSAENDHGPGLPLLESVLASVLLDGVDFGQARVQRPCHELVHWDWVVAFHEIRVVPVALQQLSQFRVRETGEYGGSCN